MGLRLTIALRATTFPADDLVQDEGMLDGCDVPDWLRRALGLSAEWGGSALVRLFCFASRPVVVATSRVIGATRAPAFGDGIHAVAKRGQKTGGPGYSLDEEPLGGPA